MKGDVYPNLIRVVVLLYMAKKGILVLFFYRQTCIEDKGRKYWFKDFRQNIYDGYELKSKCIGE